MNIKNVKYLNKLRKFGYPLNEMLIVGSGTMSLYGLKENNDIDLWVTKKVYDKMLKDDRFSSNGKMLETKDGLIEADHRFICVKDKVEDHLKRAIIVNGFYFQSLQDVLDWKKCMGRPKDHEHIKMIEKYMKTNVVENYLLEVQFSTVSLPIRKGDFKLAASYSDAHGIEQLKHSVDFLCKVGTEVLAVLPGKVTDVVDHFKEYGDKLKFAQKVNYITIQHEDNLFSQYLHLGNKQTKVKVGMNVKQGQVIGTTGLSGYMTKPHLHFHMCIMTDDDKVWKTVPFSFKPRIDIVRENLKRR